MSLPNISTAAYVYSTNQSAVKVTYVDASTAIVYRNEFTDPRTQQLNDWVRDGGQITPYTPAPMPVPGSPSFISCVPRLSVTNITTGSLIDEWTTTTAFSLSTDGTYITLLPYRTYQIDYAISVYQMTEASWMQFGPVDGSGNPLFSGDRYNVILWAAPPDTSSLQNGISSQSFLYTPTATTQVGIKCIAVGGTNTGTVRTNFTSFVVTELVDETLYAESVGPRGPAGPVGPAGPQGSAGPAGPTGPAGVTGPAGAVGPEGPVGPPGPGFTFLGQVPIVGDLPPGADTGDAYTVASDNNLYVFDGSQWNNAGQVQGPQGVVGPAGPQGPAGATGPAGPQGPQGPAGGTGPQGPQGPAGPTGAPGAKGGTGPAGPVGPQGPQGEQGPAGPMGPTGTATVQAGQWVGDMPKTSPSTWQTVQSINLPEGSASYNVVASLWWSASGDTGYGAYSTQIVVTNSTTGYSKTFFGSIANWRVINYMSYPTTATSIAGDSGLPATGTYVVNLQVSGSYQDSTSGGGNFQYAVTSW